MNLTKKILLGAFIIPTVGFLITSFILWKINPGEWTINERMISMGAIAIVFCLFGGVSLSLDEEKKISNKYLDKEFDHSEHGKVIVKSIEEIDDIEPYYQVSYKVINTGTLFNEKLANFIKKT